jgi:hypothetical protein
MVLVDLHNGAGPDDRKHPIFGKPDKSVGRVAKVEVLDQPDGNLSPYLSKLGEKARAVKPELFGRFQRHHDRVVSIGDPHCQLGLRGREHRLIPPEVAQIAAESRKNTGPMHVVDRPEKFLDDGC